jgi:hypothetical protein
MLGGQVVTISSRTTSFTVVCERCSEVDEGGLDEAGGCTVVGYGGSTFAGRLDLDLGHGTFLCRRGHPVRIERMETLPEAGATAA